MCACILKNVSSHAPVRGHHKHKGALSADGCFKSCPREGASRCLQDIEQETRSFKSCPREGASELGEEFRRDRQSFKSCPREGASGRNASRDGGRTKFQVMPP